MAMCAGLQPVPAFAFPGGQSQAAASQQAPGVKLADPNLALEQGLLGPASPVPTNCLLLKNMFSPEVCAVWSVGVKQCMWV